MNILMINKIKVVSLVSIVIFSFAIEAKPSERKDNKVDVKCFVELVGGGETISFWNIPSKKVSNLAKTITGHKVLLSNSKQKVRIYKAHECVLSKDNFTHSRAKIVDSKTAR